MSGPRHTVDQALGALAEIGRNESRVDPETSSRIAGEAAQVAASPRRSDGHGVDGIPAVGPTAGSTAPTGPTTITTASTPPGRRRRWYPAAAAAVIVIAATGYGLLDRPAQTTSTDGVVIATEPTTAETTGPTSTVSVPAIDGERGADTEATDETVGEVPATEPDAEQAPAESPTTVTTTGTATDDVSSTPTTSQTTTSTQTTGSALAADGLPVTVGDAGAVAFRLDDLTPSVVDVATNPGWTHNVTTSGSGGIEVKFTSGGDTAAVRVEWIQIQGDGGDDDDDDDDDDATSVEVFRLVVEPNPSYRESLSVSRRYEFGAAGSVDVDYNIDGLSRLEIFTGSGRPPSLTSIGSHQLDIRLAGLDDDLETRHRLEIGSLTITMQAPS